MIQAERYPAGKIIICILPLAIVPKARPRVFVCDEEPVAVPFAGPHATSKVLHMDAIKPARYSRCLKQVGLLLRVTYGNDRRWPLDASYSVCLDVAVHSSVEGDCDNLLGTIMDAGNGIVWRDDRQIAQSHVTKRIVPRDKPREALMSVTILDITGFEPKPKRQRKGTGAT